MAAQSRLWAGHDFGARTAPTAVERVLRRFQRHLVTASVPWRIRARRIGSWRRISAALIGAFAGTLLLTPPAFAVDVGSLDAAFTTANGTGANSDVRSIAVQADQKYIGGNFTDWNGTLVGRVVRLNANGTHDTAFTTNIGTGANAIVYSVVVQEDQKILVVGDFTSWNTAAVGRFLRLNGTAATGSQSQVVVLRAPVIQQFGRPLTVTCDTAASESLNWWGVASGGWSQSWATWMNDGRGGAVCTRTLRYSTVQSQWIVE